MDVKFNRDEILILKYITSERIYEMESDLIHKDVDKYLEIKELNAKLDGVLKLIEKEN